MENRGKYALLADSANSASVSADVVVLTVDDESEMQRAFLQVLYAYTCRFNAPDWAEEFGYIAAQVDE